MGVYGMKFHKSINIVKNIGIEKIAYFQIKFSNHNN